MRLPLSFDRNSAPGSEVARKLESWRPTKIVQRLALDADARRDRHR